MWLYGEDMSLILYLQYMPRCHDFTVLAPYLEPHCVTMSSLSSHEQIGRRPRPHSAVDPTSLWWPSRVHAIMALCAISWKGPTWRSLLLNFRLRSSSCCGIIWQLGLPFRSEPSALQRISPEPLCIARGAAL
nr:hypothetical protein CFP56_66842 [Quercus suber]